MVVFILTDGLGAQLPGILTFRCACAKQRHTAGHPDWPISLDSMTMVYNDAEAMGFSCNSGARVHSIFTQSAKLL